MKTRAKAVSARIMPYNAKNMYTIYIIYNKNVIIQ